jgi:hypothetical protein
VLWLQQEEERRKPDLSVLEGSNEKQTKKNEKNERKEDKQEAKKTTITADRQAGRHKQKKKEAELA